MNMLLEYELMTMQRLSLSSLATSQCGSGCWHQKQELIFVYAAVMTAMLRSQDIPTKLVVGYTGDVYHAWVDVYIKEMGWVDNFIYFDGVSWKLMDPTFASSGGNTDAVKQYIGDGANYRSKYSY